MLAAHRRALPEIDSTRYLPPYGSSLPAGLVVGEEERGEVRSPFLRRNELPEPPGEGRTWQFVRHSVGSGDFASYTITAALKTSRRARLSFPACKEWIMAEVGRLGLGNCFDDYDTYMLQNFGGGRSRRPWAERIGKKYQWIALYRLIGQVDDNVPLDPSHWEPEPPADCPPPLQAPGARHLDPTVLVRRVATDSLATAWWNPLTAELHPALPPEDWLDRMHFPDTTDQIGVTDPDGTHWLTLHTHLDWDDRMDPTDYDCERRWCWVQLRSYLVAREHSERLWHWLRKQDFHGRWMPEGLEWIPYIFAGEYPWATQAVHNIPPEEMYRDEKVPYPICPTVHEPSLEFGFDCYHDETIHLLVPAPQLLAGRELRWDGLAGYRNLGGQRRFFAPNLSEPGPMVLLAERASFVQWLEENGLDIVWTTLSEMHWIPQGVGGDHRLGYAVHSRAHRLRGTSLQKSKGVTRRLRPNAP